MNHITPTIVFIIFFIVFIVVILGTCDEIKRRRKPKKVKKRKHRLNRKIGGKRYVTKPKDNKYVIAVNGGGNLKENGVRYYEYTNIHNFDFSKLHNYHFESQYFKIYDQETDQDV